MNKKRDIAVTIQNMGQYYSVEKGLEELVHRGYTIDLYIPYGRDGNGMEAMFDDTYKALENKDYTCYREEQDIEYKVLLEPYPMEYYLTFKYKYRVKYTYAALCAKPNLVYSPDNYICYDGIICYGNHDSAYLAAYSEPHVIGNMLFYGYKKQEKKQKTAPVLLYLPTYSTDSSLKIMLSKIEELSKKYHVIIKFHHGTSFLKNELELMELFKSKCHEWYDHNTQLVELLEKADVVLSDNSGSIFEAIYAKVPVCIIAEKLNGGIEGIRAPQVELIEQGIIPYTSEVTQIEDVIEKAMTKDCIEKQNKIRNEWFHISENMPNEFADVVEKYLKDDVNEKRKQLHDMLYNRYREYQEAMFKLPLLETEADKLRKNVIEFNEKYQREYEQNQSLTRQLSYYENGKLYKIAKQIYKIAFRILQRE